MNINLNDILLFMRDYGLPVTILLAIIISGAKRAWYFSAGVEDMKAQYEARLRDKSEQIERWQKVAEQNGAAAQESVILARQMKETLDKIDGDLRRGESDRGRGGGRASGSVR